MLAESLILTVRYRTLLYSILTSSNFRQKSNTFFDSHARAHTPT